MTNNPPLNRDQAPVIHRVGSRALLIDLPGLETVMAWHAALTAAPLAGQRSAIAAAQTILLEFNSRLAAKNAATTLGNYSPDQQSRRDPLTVTIDVVYDGEDLAATAELLGMSTEKLITRHTSERWMAAFGGFAPGFTYCVPQDFDWDIPRRDNPRTAVPAGAVALAGEYSAVYPRQSPGGWQLIGHTDTPMWSDDSSQPALLLPGDLVRYRSVKESITVDPAASTDSSRTPQQRIIGRPVIRVDHPGLQSLYQDLGRHGHGDIGVNGSGAVDRASASVANDAVGNHHTAPVIENLGGLKLSALVDTVVAVTGAQTTITHSTRSGATRNEALAQPIALHSGESLSISDVSVGARSYVAVRGGCAAETVLGSSSSDVLSGLGPAPLSAGDTVKSAGKITGAVRTSAVNPVDFQHAQSPELRVVLGPRADWFSNSTIQKFLSASWQVTEQSNRIGLRLGHENSAVAIARSRDGELQSEGMVAGSIQVPPNGMPVVFLSDHPVTGGYPVIATVISEDLGIAGQLPPGASVTFVAVDPDTLEPLSDYQSSKTAKEKS